MIADDLNKLPRYIEAPSSGMWGPLPEGFHLPNEDRIFIKLKDVLDLLKQTTEFVVPVCPDCKNEIDLDVCQCGEYIQQHGCHAGHTPVPMGCTCGYVQKHPRPFQ